MTLDVLPEWPPPAAPVPDRLPPPEPTADDAPPPTMGHFSAALARAGLFDNEAIDLPGSVVVLPYGVELLRRFRQRVDTAYRAHGLEEHEYPLLVPASCLEPSQQVLDLGGRVLYAGREDELGHGPGALALLPTGEAAVYTHWSRRVRTRGDLPVRAYRRARYFRPVSRGRHGGRGLFYALEHDDIFEFHCAYASEAELRDDLRRYWAMLADTLRALHLPALWSTRPPWTNRHEVAEWAIAADVPLPTRATTQVGAVYNQGTRFSGPYGVEFREGGRRHPAVQLSGYVSRRALLVHLLLGLRPSGHFLVHPDVSPVAVAVLLRADGANDEDLTRALVDTLDAEGMAARLVAVDRPSRVAPTVETWATRGTPVVLLLFAPRHGAEPWRAVLRRSDTEDEAALPDAEPATVVEACRAALAAVGRAYIRHVEGLLRRRLVETAAEEDTRAALRERQVAVCPLVVDAAAVERVGAWRMGEVLGYCRTRERRPCVLTGEAVETVALVSPRS